MDGGEELSGDKLIEWLNQRFVCFENINRQEHQEINKKIDALDKFRWQIIGGSLVVSSLVAALFQIFIMINK